MIFGWGMRQRSYPLDEAHELILTYRYIHIFWLFTVVFKYRYSLATLTESGWAAREVSADEAAAMHGGTAPKPAFWWRWGLALYAAASLILVAIL